MNSYIKDCAENVAYAGRTFRAYGDKMRADYVRDCVRNGLTYGLGITPKSVTAVTERGFVVRVTVQFRRSKHLSARVDKLYQLIGALGGKVQPDGTALFFTGKL